jgi:competence protein ComEA
MYRFYRFMYGLVGFSTSQTNGFLIFLPLLLAILISEPLYRRWKSAQRRDFSSETRRLDSLVALLNEDIPPAKSDKTEMRIIISKFDPNTVSESEILEMGVPNGLASRWKNYRNKGGRFKIKSDLLHLYGMDSVIYAKLKDYIQLPDKEDGKGFPLPHQGYTQQRNVTVLIPTDINAADTASLKKIFGIGEKMSLRIVKYRDALGGFVSMDQLKEVFNLDSTIIKSLKKKYYVLTNFVPKQLDLNLAGRQELSTHPYLSSRAASAIVTYRFQHGNFEDIQELRKIASIDSVMLRKLVPYLKLNQP